jgi:hypothetical protein
MQLLEFDVNMLVSFKQHSILSPTGLMQALAETFQRLDLRLAALQQQQQQHVEHEDQQQQQQHEDDQQRRGMLLELALLGSAGNAARHMSLFGEAAVLQLQPAAAHLAVAVLRSWLPGCAKQPIVVVLFYCTQVMTPISLALSNSDVQRLQLEVSRLEQQQQQVAAAAGMPAPTEAPASAESAADAAAATALNAALHSKDFAEIAAFQLAAVALQLHNSSSSRHSRQQD